jgi:hypothetical protein
MSKIKLSFSLILAIFLVGILGTAAFAKDPYGLKPTQVEGTLNLSIPFSFNSAAGETASTQFDLHVIDPSTNTDKVAWTGITKPTTPKVATNLTPGVIYTVKLTYAGQTDALSKATGVVYDPHNADMYKANGTAADGTLANSATVDVSGSGLHNANETGYNNTRKQRSGQSLHGSYQNNTNSCATCHQTHTAAEGDYLLFKDGTYSTCSACHDGTTGAYNSFSPVTAENTDSIAGTFDVHGAGQNGSLHQADGSLKISAAPGGSSTSAKYNQDFDCASCHNAHGSGSNTSAGIAGENNLNVDPMGWGRVPYSATAGEKVTYYKGHGMVTETTTIDNKNGKLFFNIGILTGVPTTKTTPYILVKTTAKDTDITSPASTTSGNYFWSRAGVKVGDQVIQTYRWSSTKYVPDYSLWLRELSYPFVANTVLFSDTDQKNSLNMDSNLTIVWRDGFAYGSSVANIKSANVSLGIDVETTGKIEDLWSGAAPDSGIEMSKYCGACHADYVSETRTDVTGTYTTAHRHANISRDELTCVRCHYAHGSEAQILHDANDNTYYDLTTKLGMTSSTALDYLKDTNPSSALKRYTGMSVCYACHGGGETFVGSPRNNKADTTTNEFLKAGLPGEDRSVISK